MKYGQIRAETRRLISSSLLPSADGLQSPVRVSLVTPEVWELPPEGHPQAQKHKNQGHKYYTKTVSLLKCFLLTCLGAGLSYSKQRPAVDSLILILQDAQKSLRSMKTEKSMKVNSSFSKVNWKKYLGLDKASVTV